MTEKTTAPAVVWWMGDFGAYAMLTLAFVFMSLNVIVGRAVHDDIAPFSLSFWRWVIASVVFLPISFKTVRREWPLIVTHWKYLLLLSIVMIPVGNSLVYVGLQSTTALNGGLIPVSRPAIILVLAWLMFRGTVSSYQWLGVGIAMLGVLTVLTGGDPAVLATFDLNRGDLWLFASSIGIASYQVLVSRALKIFHTATILQFVMISGVVLVLPFYLWETASGRPVEVTWTTAGAILYVAIFPSVIATYLITTGIKIVGSARAGIFNYLPPIFVALIAIPLLGETLNWYHPAALFLIAGGIFISSRRRQSTP